MTDRQELCDACGITILFEDGEQQPKAGVEVEGVLDLRAVWLTMYSCCMLW